ncbi:MAG: hypothetical protein R2831_02310 [Chitinophagaceae bacterium]
MKYLILSAILLLSFSSCVKQQTIPYDDIVGVWKLNGYSSTRYEMEITSNAYFYWHAYNLSTNVKEFELEYDIDKNTICLYKPNKSTMQYSFRIYHTKNGRLYFDVPYSAYDSEGNTTTQYDRYYKID